MFSREEKKEIREAFEKLGNKQVQKLIEELKEKVIALGKSKKRDGDVCSYLAYDPISKEFKVFAHPPSQCVGGVVYFYMLRLEEVKFSNEAIRFDIEYTLREI